jgi:phosphate transport system permease protein
MQAKRFRQLSLTACLLMPLIMLAIAAFLFKSSLPVWQHNGFELLTSSNWDPTNDHFGGLTSLLGTLLSSGLALCIAIPVSLLAACVLKEGLPSWLSKPLRILLDVMAGIPSIVYGMWGLFVLVPWLVQYVEPSLINTLGTWPLLDQVFAGPAIGVGMLAASLILAAMIIPWLTLMTLDLLDTTNPLLKEAATALGATRLEVVKILFSSNASGVIGAGMLGLGRALGETMAVTFVIGNTAAFSWNLFAPGTTVAATIANEFAEATGTLFPASLMGLGLLLFFMTLVVTLLARTLIYRARGGK